jgi:hypothetical protein
MTPKIRIDPSQRVTTAENSLRMAKANKGLPRGSVRSGYVSSVEDHEVIDVVGIADQSRQLRVDTGIADEVARELLFEEIIRQLSVDLRLC